MTNLNTIPFAHRHLLDIARLNANDINQLLDLAESYASLSRTADKKQSILSGKTQINLFFENSTRTRTSFELAGKRLGADVINMSVAPECILANELEIPYAAIALSTDYDCWKTDEAPVTWEEVIKVFNQNVENVLNLLVETISGL